ncbi:MAG TPA: TolC family protein [Myxococcaceae bacterium]|nr:TolC family protein [Myxococcaceae bacterium]
MTGLLLSLVVASTPITLDEVRKEARNNLQALQAVLTWQQSYEQIAINRGILFPQISVGANASRTWNSVTEARTIIIQGQPVTAGGPANAANNFLVSANLNQVLIDAGRWYALKQAGLLEVANKGLAEDQAQASEFEAIRRFYVLYTAQVQLKVLEETAQKSKEFADRAQALFEAGRGTKGDALAALVNYYTDLNNAIQQRLTVEQAQIDLASWIGRNEDADLVAVQPASFGQPPVRVPAMDRALETAKMERAILRAYTAQIGAAQANVTVQQAFLFPRLNGLLAFQHSSNKPGTAFTDLSVNNTYFAQLSLNWNIFDGMSTFAASRQAEVQVASAKLTYAQSERDVTGQVRTALDGLTNQTQALAVISDNRDTAAKNLDYYEERFKAGASNTLDVRDAQVKLLAAELTLAQTRANVQVAEANLERAMGTLGNGAKP